GDYRLILPLLLLIARPSKQHEFTARGGPIQNVIYSNDKIFVGATNNLYELRAADLSLLSSASIGPVPDSPFCSLDGGNCLRGHSKLQTDNANKLLTLLPSGLLECGSVKHGVCSLRDSSDVSRVIENYGVPVAANAPNASTSWLSLPSGLVVAASHTVDSPYREVPTISYRTLEDLQVLNAGSLEGESAVFVRAEFRPLFPQTFVSTFQYENFVYVAVVQPSQARRLPPSAPLITKLARFCAGDERFISYSEIELQCRGEDNSNLNVLTAVHLRGDKMIAAFTSSTTGQSAVCVYSMPRIKVTFWYNIDRCRGGADSIGLPHIGRDTRCLNRSHLPLEENSCELGVGGRIEASEMALLSLQSPVRVIASNTRPDVVFMGGDDGKVIKLKAKDSGALLEYSTLDLSRDGPISSLIFVEGRRMIVHQGTKLRIVAVAECERNEECASCLLSKDPFCGWCPASTLCASFCPVENADKCPILRGPPSPSFLPVSTSANISIPIENLPRPDGFSYQCVFDSSLVSTAIFSPSALICPTPMMPKTRTTSTVSLSIRTSSSPRSIATHNFTFYDCGQYTTCSSCLSSHWKCSWCGNSCTLDKECAKPSSQCVQIAPTQRLLLPSGRPTTLSFKVEHAEQLTTSVHSCRVRAGARRVRVRAEVSGDSVFCRGLKVESRSANVTYALQLVNDEREEIVDETQVTVFDCALLASDCSSCLTGASAFGCSWCAGRCSVDCPPTGIRSADPDVVCNAPTILAFHPTSAPLEGGTLLTVLGRDLGADRSDIEGRILVAGSRCHLRDFNVSTGFTCVLEKGSGSGPVRVAIGHSARRTAESANVFSFHNVEITSMSPPFGPLSGGTSVVLFGRHLDAGSNVEVMIGEQPCVVKMRNSSSSFSCVTTVAKRAQTVGPLRVKIDNATRSVSSISFEYRLDPVIHSISPLSAFRSGGRLMVVKGASLDSVLSARLFILSSHEEPNEIVSDLAPCQIVNATLMHCLSPALVASEQPPSTVSSWPLGLQMDGVTSLHRLPRRLAVSIVADPHFEPFEGIRVHLSGQSLIIDGQHLSMAAEPRDYKILIGSSPCVVTVVDDRQLVCTPPMEQPEARDEKGGKIDGLPTVTVTIGRLKYELGLLEYSTGSLSRRVWLAVLISVAALLVLLAVLIVIWRRKNEQREKDYKKIQIQMENLESNVRKECKQAFAELQTTIEETNEEETGVFVLPKDEFASRLLWIDGPPHPSTTIYSTSQPVTLAQLDSLLCSPDFIRCFVFTADSDPSSSPQEKSLLSSLIISALASNFEYLTQVILMLLREHIASTVQHRSPTLVFRQSESLVELMFQKWFSLCMYDFVSDRGAPQLQTLHTAFKLQSDRGPVDCLTGAARYTINESKLLRETVDSTPIDLLITSMEGRGPYAVRVLACDSISQVKRKAIDTIYRTVPATEKPHLGHVVMEWQRPDGECITLRDTEEGDSTGRRNGKNPKRIQTVTSSGLTHGSLLLMCAARRTPSSGADSGQCSWSSLDCSSLSQSAHFHLVPPTKNGGGKTRFSDSIPQSIPEIYLTRLLTSKGAVQKYIDELMESVLIVNENSLPPALKIVCDLLDEAAVVNKISDPLLVHQWKANCLVLRFWVQLISNSRLIIDVDSCVAVDANMAIIGQTLMASCSSGEPLLHADSPSSRLLFAREISRLRPLSTDLFSRIRRAPAPTTDWTSRLIPIDQPSRSLPLGELLSWVRGNGLRLVQLLEQRTDPSLRLPSRLSHLLNLSIEPEHIYATLN
ncbi:hypothetical protein PFISCL1PPCAC_16432, partial [Pristionchus fissidentatus]